MTGKQLIITLGLASIILFWEGVWLVDKIGQWKSVAILKTKWLQTIIQAIYFLGVPYLILITGHLPDRFFGLKGLEFLAMPTSGQSILSSVYLLLTQIGNVLLTWLPDLGPMAATSSLLSATFILFLWVYLQAARSAPDLLQNIYQSKIGIIFEVTHWAFYRAIIWFITGSIYLGCLGGILLIVFEYTIAARTGKFPPLLQQQYLLRFSLGLVTSVAFLFTPNLWLTLVFQTALVIVTEGALRIARSAGKKRHEAEAVVLGKQSSTG